MWMSGYNARNRPTDQILTDLWCKALAIEDPKGARAVVLSAELCGIPAALSEKVAAELKKGFGLPREAVMVTVTHTHSGPPIKGYLEALAPTFAMPEEHRAEISRYTRWMEEELVRVASCALRDLEPVALSYGTGKASFAVNRRNNSAREVEEKRARGEPLAGPVDHEVPVLAAARSDGSIKAILTAYACHATVLSGYEFSGDWPGFAQIELERNFPEATVLFVAGCAGDADPIPRQTVERAQAYGRQLADAVWQTLQGAMLPVRGELGLRQAVIDLPFDHLPDKQTLHELENLPRRLVADGQDVLDLPGERVAEILRARILLRKYETTPLDRTYPYPLQCWRLGNDLTWISLSGEVTAGYALRIRQNLCPDSTWVTAFAHDVMGYIPTRSVWEEGGYEGDTSTIYYALPARWCGDVEEIIVHHALKLARAHRMPAATS